MAADEKMLARRTKGINCRRPLPTSGRFQFYAVMIIRNENFRIPSNTNINSCNKGRIRFKRHCKCHELITLEHPIFRQQQMRCFWGKGICLGRLQNKMFEKMLQAQHKKWENVIPVNKCLRKCSRKGKKNMFWRHKKRSQGRSHRIALSSY